VAGAFPQLIYGFRDGIESMNDQVIAEPVPGWTLAALNADVDEHEGLTQKARLHHPVGELGIGIGEQIQPLLLPTLRGRSSAAFQAQREQDTSIPMIKKGWAPKRCFLPTARGSQDARSRSFMERSCRRAGDRPLLGLLASSNFRSRLFERGQRSGPAQCALYRNNRPVLLAACASAIESPFTVFADPGKYEWYSRDQLVPQRKLWESKEKELKLLMEKAK
jgi:hypothetical protein